MRLVLANPLLCNGIILFDDIEKNLHPKNQSKVLNKLNKLNKLSELFPMEEELKVAME